MRRSILVAIAAVTALATVVLFPPATWADWALARATAGRVRVAQADGTLWHGAGRVVITDPLDIARTDQLALPGVALPGTLTWTISPWRLLLGQLDLTAKLDNMREPLRLSGSFTDLRGSGSSLALPPLRLDRIGSPWNTIQPDGALSLTWEAFQIRAGRFAGKAIVEVRDASSALSSVKPLGAYRIDINAAGDQATVAMTTLVGPLRLDGSGTWTPRQGLRFSGVATSDDAQRVQLAPLLGMLGRRDGDRTIIRIGA